MSLIAYKNLYPKVAGNVYVAPGAFIVGDVEIEAGASVWFNAVLRGDIAPIYIGAKSNLQDNVTVHVNRQEPVQVGSGVTVGHNAVLHGCTVEDYVLIGIGAIVMNGAVVGHDSIVAAGTLVTQNVTIPPYSLVMGSPGKVVRTLSPEETPRAAKLAERYCALAREYLQG